MYNKKIKQLFPRTINTIPYKVKHMNIILKLKL